MILHFGTPQTSFFSEDWNTFCPRTKKNTVSCLGGRFFTKKKYACFQMIWNVMSVFLVQWIRSSSYLLSRFIYKKLGQRSLRTSIYYVDWIFNLSPSFVDKSTTLCSWYSIDDILLTSSLSCQRSLWMPFLLYRFMRCQNLFFGNISLKFLW